MSICYWTVQVSNRPIYEPRDLEVLQQVPRVARLAQVRLGRGKLAANSAYVRSSGFDIHSRTSKRFGCFRTLLADITFPERLVAFWLPAADRRHACV